LLAQLVQLVDEPVQLPQGDEHKMHAAEDDE